jgi:hypothetical protein
MPDLHSYGYSWYDGCQFQLIQVYVSNDGDAESNPFFIGARVDKVRYGVTSYDQVLAPGEAVWVQGTWPLIHLSVGTHRIDFLLDARHDVQESNEGDNLTVFSVVCT